MACPPQAGGWAWVPSPQHSFLKALRAQELVTGPVLWGALGRDRPGPDAHTESHRTGPCTARGHCLAGPHTERPRLCGPWEVGGATCDQP